MTIQIATRPEIEPRNDAEPENPVSAVVMKGGITVLVPSSLDLLTPYVLIEQRDWFEPELDFLRTWLRPGMRVVDIGANYGVYTLTMAQIVGPSGRVIAFEPTPLVAACLKASADCNSFHHVEVVPIGLSNQSGLRRMKVERNSELNALVEEGTEAAQCIQVTVDSLDSYVGRRGLAGLDLVKLDAEGEERRILEGAEELLRAHSPLVLFEIRHREVADLGLLEVLGSYGYEPYVLVPGLNLLRPFEREEPLDPSQLNLFACRRERAESLSSQGMLVIGRREVESLPATDKTFYHHWLDDLPYAERLADAWAKSSSPGNGEYLGALGDYALSHRCRGASPAERLAYLERALYSTLRAIGQYQSAARLSSFIRINRELGNHGVAAAGLQELLGTLGGDTFSLDEPFLCVTADFDRIPPGERLADWFVASVLTQIEKSSARSSYFITTETPRRLQTIATTGFATAEMKRRLQLVLERFDGGSRRASETPDNRRPSL